MATLMHDMRHFAFAGITDNDTKKSYARSIERFCSWLEERDGRCSKMRDLKGKKLDLLNEYTRHMKSRKISPFTIHTYLTPICKAFQIPMNKVDKPVRKAAAITRSRMPETNLQGKREAQSRKYARTVSFQRMVGIRRSELKDLRIRDLVQDESGRFCVLVERGKGGKRQKQVILPQYEKAVKAVFVAAAAAGLGPDDRLFTVTEMKNVIDYHGIRAEVAREAYKYYLERIIAGEKDHLKEILVSRWNAEHESRYQIVKAPSGRYVPAMPKNNAKTAKFCKELNNETEYVLRGDNRTKAVNDGALMHYDRIALLCVSVFHLSHWRNDVTASHYMI